MLVLSRKVGETVVVDNDIRITIVAVYGDKIRLGITAPTSVRVDREEVHERRREFQGRLRRSQSTPGPDTPHLVTVEVPR
jgi:carbon storage regulator